LMTLMGAGQEGLKPKPKFCLAAEAFQEAGRNSAIKREIRRANSHKQRRPSVERERRPSLPICCSSSRRPSAASAAASASASDSLSASLPASLSASLPSPTVLDHPQSRKRSPLKLPSPAGLVGSLLPHSTHPSPPPHPAHSSLLTPADGEQSSSSSSLQSTTKDASKAQALVHGRFFRPRSTHGSAHGSGSFGRSASLSGGETGGGRSANVRRAASLSA